MNVIQKSEAIKSGLRKGFQDGSSKMAKHKCYGYTINSDGELSELFEITIEPQTIWSAVGLHGAGGYRAQCGLVEGSLMFIGIYLHGLGKSEDEIVSACYNFASAFEKTFGSLRCLELSPSGFSESDPPHLCENLTCNGIEFAYQYILGITKQ